MTQPVLVDVVVEHSVATVTLKHPPVNALSLDLLTELHRRVLDAAASPDVGAIVIWGGERAFVAGGDIELLERSDPGEFRSYFRFMQQAWDEIEAVPVPTIAAVNGFALGGGCELALSCDLRVAGQSAKLGLPEVNLGLFPAAGGTARLARQVGKGRALEIVWNARAVAAQEAAALGMVEFVVADDAVLQTSRRIALRLANGPRDAIAAAKRSILAGLDGGLRAELRTQVREVEALFGTPDNQEGLAAFLEKRPPEFGRQPRDRDAPD